MDGCACSGFTGNQLWVDDDLTGDSLRADLPKDRLGREDAHIVQGLSDGGEGGVLKRGRLDVVEADHGDILGDAEAGLADGADGAYGGDVIKGEDGGEALGRGEETLRGVVTGLVGGVVSAKLGDQVGVKLEAHLPGYLADRAPPGLGIGAEALSLDDGEAAVAERVEMEEGELGGAAMVEGDVGDAGGLMVAGDGDGGDGAAAGQGRIDGDDALDGAVEQKGLGAVDHGGLMVMADEEMEVSGLEQVLFYAAENEGGVALANLGNEDADGLAAAVAEGAGGEVGAVVETFRGGKDTVLRGLGDGLCGGGGVEHARDGGGREMEVVREDFEADGRGVRRGFGSRRQRGRESIFAGHPWSMSRICNGGQLKGGLTPAFPDEQYFGIRQTIARSKKGKR